MEEKKSTWKEIGPGHSRKLAYLDNLMVAVCEFTDGPSATPDPPHSHPHEQITYVAEGELLFFIEDKPHNLKKGDIITIESGVPHCIQRLSERVLLVDSFSPVREDFLK